MSLFTKLLADVERCTLCSEHLPLGPRPVVQLHPDARILVAGQAPGKRVHETGIPFNDPSGDRLREWMGISKAVFYDEKTVALLPMGFCFPGTGKSGDLPPRPECAKQWRGQLLAQLPNVELTLVLGKYAQNYHFDNPKLSLTELVSSWHNYWPAMAPLPHPSPRNNIWLSKNPWFEKEFVPALQARVKEIRG
ncbi:IclR family transcriptional regulator [Vibrio breoganii]|uniref:uracil-DNA glycosylase family protein n=1 Tax=Vibrio breoganii TaxID=553239 RepID=UPI00080EAC11|nr:uracil-DNA glycosylase family protein [Vibrio breoganii]OCH74192.1 IclR family transcriptional regulator [Vibrio breoganii]PMK26629.1 IclR family transcriptional regulator [Vibrio breoganii]PML27482.1 IclR family transcriptional regulator [Vibrio breoganii]PML42279.1 IclR family transcriptional regulator [Vibrio breoganii]PMM07502.1 IclR family transcriptional regulator [Vibrio breoganii]